MNNTEAKENLFLTEMERNKNSEPGLVIKNQDDNLLGRIDNHGVYHAPRDGLCGYHVITFMLKVNLFLYRK